MNPDPEGFPVPPPGRDPNAVAEPPAPSPHRSNWFPGVYAVLIFAALLAWLWAFVQDTEAAPAPSPAASPVAAPGVHITAPSDAVVLTELEAQLAVFRSQGGEAANARLLSYRRGVESAGCKVGLSHGTGFSNRAEANARGIAYITAARDALAGDGVTFGGASVIDKAARGWDYYAIFVVCPP